MFINLGKSKMYKDDTFHFGETKIILDWLSYL